MTQPLHTIHCRFKLDTTLRKRVFDQVDDETGRHYIPAEGADVTFSAVQGKPFGKATPQGQMGMTIVEQTLVPHLLHEVPLYTEYDVVFFPRTGEKSHPDLVTLLSKGEQG